MAKSNTRIAADIVREWEKRGGQVEDLVPMLSRMLFEYIPDQQRTDDIATRVVEGYTYLRHQDTGDNYMLKVTIEKLLENAQKGRK